MIRTIAILVLLAATAADAQLTTTVKRIRLEHATAAELAGTTLDLGHAVFNEENPADLRIGDGETPGGIRVGSDWWTNNMLTAWGGLSRVDVEALVALSIPHVDLTPYALSADLLDYARLSDYAAATNAIWGSLASKAAASNLLAEAARLDGRIDGISAAGLGAITAEADPIFAASAAAGITSSNLAAWSAAYGWGDHSAAGYLTEESDPDFSAWLDTDPLGDLLSSYNEVDPLFSASAAYGITESNLTVWSLAYGWGDHSQAGYLTEEDDPAWAAAAPKYARLRDVEALLAFSLGYPQEQDSAAMAAVAAVSGRVDIVEGWGDHSEAGYLTAEADAAALGVIGSATNELLDLAGTRAMTGDVVTLARDVKSRKAASVGDYGAAFGYNTAAGDFGAAFGDRTTAGNYGAAFGYNTAAGDFGAAFGYGTTAGDSGAAFGSGTVAGEFGAAFGWDTTAGNCGFSAGSYAHGTTGSFVFADYSSGTPFNRTNSPNSFSVRAAGGTYFDTPLFTVTGEVAVESNLVVGTGIVNDSAISNWDAAYDWGDHAEAGYLTEETDAAALGAIGSATNALLDLAGTRAMTGNLNMGKQGITNATYISSIGGDIPYNLVVKAGSAGLYGPSHVNGGNLLLSAGTPRGTGTMGRVVAQGVFDATNLTASTNLVVTTTRSADIRIGPEYGIEKSAGIPGKNLYLFASDAGPAATAGSVVITAGSGGKYGTNGAIELVGGVSMTGDVNMQSNRVLNADIPGYLPLAGHNGPVVLGTRTRGYAASTNLGDYGAAFGEGTTAGGYGAAFGDYTTAENYGAAFGQETTAGEFGAAFGYYTTAGDYGAAFGYGTTAGDWGFSAGRDAHGSTGSFVFADNSADEMPFDRTNSPNSFSVRAAGGTYFDTPLFTVTGEVAVESNLVVGNGQVFLNSSGTSWLQLDGTNIQFRATNGVTGRIQIIYE